MLYTCPRCGKDYEFSSRNLAEADEMIKIALGININIMIKREVLDGPLGIILRPIGLIPINRSAALNVVGQMVQRFQQYEQMWLGITPEGTSALNATTRTAPILNRAMEFE